MARRVNAPPRFSEKGKIRRVWVLSYVGLLKLAFIHLKQGNTCSERAYIKMETLKRASAPGPQDIFVPSDNLPLYSP